MSNTPLSAALVTFLTRSVAPATLLTIRRSDGARSRLPEMWLLITGSLVENGGSRPGCLSGQSQMSREGMRIIQALAFAANVAALVWVAYMWITYSPLTRELALAGLIAAYPILNLIALADHFRRRKS
jgi:hypothetical protein